MNKQAGTEFESLVATMHRLRAPGGCPWDAEQTHATLKPYAIEEAHELAAAIDHGDDASLRDELGDLLLQVIFHAELAAERSAFQIADVVEH
ncbi:MAG: nucleoside triphosphate pyrophosphohydrolase, partial [Myxococcales bacterium]